ncbi:MAG: hypothetical protein HUK26_03765 [Duodenibacillus sp.]|nr:hypothetical protein [Duodenibacillus sp.]
MTIALPLPSPRTSEAYVATLAQGVRQAFGWAGVDCGAAPDPLIAQARGLLVVDEAESVREIGLRLSVGRDRAQALFEAVAAEAGCRVRRAAAGAGDIPSDNPKVVL